MLEKVAALTVAACGCSGVMLGAYGFHGLGDKKENQRNAFNIAVEYQLLHACAMTGLLAIAVQPSLSSARRWAVRSSIGLMAVGTALFCGVIYGKVLGEESFPVSMGRLAPIGGSLMMLGWAAIAAIPFL